MACSSPTPSSIKSIPFSESICPICRQNLEPTKDGNWSTVTVKGRNTIKSYSELYGDTELYNYLDNLDTNATINVHISCRKTFTSERRFQQFQQRQNLDSTNTSLVSPTKQLRSSASFEWKTSCFLCAESAEVDPKHPSPDNDISCVLTLRVNRTIRNACEKRTDRWGLEVSSRISTCVDLVAADAVYHRNCFRRFVNTKSVKADVQPGRPKDTSKHLCFELLCDWLDDSYELYTLSELHEKMCELAGHDDIYTEKWLQRMLLEHYGEHIFFAHVNGRNNVACFRDMASMIVNDKWYSDRKTNITDDSQRIILAAARLIKSQIREASYSSDSYPASSLIADFAANKVWIPQWLDFFLEHLINSPLKAIGIGHSIVQAARLRSAISPILLAVGVSSDHLLGSRWLIDMLSRLGFSVSYDEVTNYKQSCVSSNDYDLISTPSAIPDMFVQWSADNVDHNIQSLDGKGSFHGMGIISMTSYPRGVQGSFGDNVVVRRQRLKVSDLVRNSGIPIIHIQDSLSSSLSAVILKPIEEMNFPRVVTSPLDLDLAWHCSWHFINNRPNWSGYMQDITGSTLVGDYAPPAQISMLPIIDLNPNDRNCIYSTLRFVELQASRLNMETACITFDQPLWLKAVEITRSEHMNVVCRLGAFHTQMSFLGSIGSNMSGSGLQAALEQVFGSVSVNHILSGKSVARSVRAHLLVDSALHILLLEHIIESADSDTLDNLQLLCEKLQDHSFSINDDANLISMLHEFEKKLTDLKDQLGDQNRTAAYWLQYLDHVKTLKDFIRAERSSDWPMHLHCIKDMLNLFAATGHRHYAKSARLYLQLMLELPDTHPWLHQQLLSLHAPRRTDKYWGELATDLLIEQVMMKSVKSRGGLTHGRGLNESVRLVWVKSMHQCAMIYSALSNLTNLDRSLSGTEQMHTEMGKARITRDNGDLTKSLLMRR